MTSQRLIELLAERSADAITSIGGFSKATCQHLEVRREQELKSVSLNEAKFLARRERLNVRKATESAGMEQVTRTRSSEIFILMKFCKSLRTMLHC